jgi:DNA-binding NarL/FixJ family response regulator
VTGRIGRSIERRAAHSRELTKREMTVLQALVQGKRNKEIASELYITERTVKYHIKSIFNKLQVRNRTQAVRAAYDQGFVGL